MASALLSKLTTATAGAAVLAIGVASTPAPADAAILNFTTTTGGIGILNYTGNVINSFRYTPSDNDFTAITRSVNLAGSIAGFVGIGFNPLAGTDLAKISTPNLGGPNSLGFKVTQGLKTWFGVFATPGAFSADNPSVSGYVGISFPDNQGGFNSQTETVPEPTTIVGSLLGLGAMAGARLKRKTAQ